MKHLFFSQALQHRANCNRYAVLCSFCLFMSDINIASYVDLLHDVVNSSNKALTCRRAACFEIFIKNNVFFYHSCVASFLRANNIIDYFRRLNMNCCEQTINDLCSLKEKLIIRISGSVAMRKSNHYYQQKLHKFQHANPADLPL